MKKENLLETAYQLTSSLNEINSAGELGKLLTMVAMLGYSNEDLEAISIFIDKSITEEEFNQHVERRAFSTYIKALEQAKKHLEMAKGYGEMGDINLTISKEDHHLEEEGAKAYEMVRTDTKGENQAG